MPFFRVQYQGYLEGDFDDQQDAVDEFLEELEYGDLNLNVEQWNDETGEWEQC